MPTRAQARTPRPQGRGARIGACRTPGLNSPVWVPDSGSARSPEPPDSNQPPIVLRPVNRLAHLRLLRHGSSGRATGHTGYAHQEKPNSRGDQPRYGAFADDEHFKGQVFGRSN